jgi:hypothetical protein
MRLTPFELVCAGGIEERFAEVRSEAAAVAKDPSDLGQFVSLSTVQNIIAAIESPELLAEHPAAASEYHVLLYSVFCFWAAGKNVLELGDDFATESALAHTTGRDVPNLPGGACYIQLPERQFWAQVDAAAPHEPIDGLFVVQSSDRLQFTAVAVLGLRRERAGFSQISATVTSDATRAALAASRIPLFAPVMAGGAAAGFKSVTSVGELIALADLALAHATR